LGGRRRGFERGLRVAFGMAHEPELGSAGSPVNTLYVFDVNADRSASVLRTVNRIDGRVTTLTADWAAGQPGMVWVDLSGVVYVSSYVGDTVMKMTSDGKVTLLAGSPGVEGSADGTGDLARFSGPMGIVGDASGTLYVADSYNSTIRAIRCP
jgi:sugar lactone lactonase YvrE